MKELMKIANRNAKSRTNVACHTSRETGQEFYLLTKQQFELLTNVKFINEDDPNDS